MVTSFGYRQVGANINSFKSPSQWHTRRKREEAQSARKKDTGEKNRETDKNETKK